MADDRRGFLKSIVAAGSTLILPNAQKKIILPSDVVDAPCQTLDACIIIPMGNVVEMKYHEKPRFLPDVERQFVTIERHMSLVLKCDGLTRIATFCNKVPNGSRS